MRSLLSNFFEYYLKKEFTSMSERDKDVMQRTYFHVNQIVKFLRSPQQWVINRRNLYSKANGLRGDKNGRGKTEHRRAKG